MAPMTSATVDSGGLMLPDRDDSQRSPRPPSYRVADLASDLVAVMEAAGFERFSVFGYSFTGAFAPWLAHLTGRVDAVVSGGFPIAGDYSPLYPEIQALSAAAEADPAAWADLNSRFDNRAALAFYRELSELPPDFLSATCHARCSRSGARKTRRSPGEGACDCSPPGWTAAGSSTRPSPVTTTKACWPISMRRYRASWPGSTACPRAE